MDGLKKPLDMCGYKDATFNALEPLFSKVGVMLAATEGNRAVGDLKMVRLGALEANRLLREAQSKYNEAKLLDVTCKGKREELVSEALMAQNDAEDLTNTAWSLYTNWRDKK